MDRPGVRQVPEGSGEQGKMEKTGCKIICAVLTTLTVEGLMTMMKADINQRIGGGFFLPCEDFWKMLTIHSPPTLFSLKWTIGRAH